MPFPLLGVFAAFARGVAVTSRFTVGAVRAGSRVDLGGWTHAPIQIPQITATVRGIPELKRALQQVGEQMRRRIMLDALRAGGRLVRDGARSAAPVISPMAMPVRLGYRKPGTVRKAISVRTSRVARQQGNVGVFVNVRPAKGARYATTTRGVLGLKVRTRTLKRASQRGAKSPNDPFYWRFLEFGTRHMHARSFLKPAAGRLGAALAVIERRVVAAVAKMNEWNVGPR